MPAVAAVIAAGGVAAHAHHSISAIYDSGRRVTVEGVVTNFQLINPHPWLFVDVKDGAGEARHWRLEMDNRGELENIGVTANTFKPGDRVVATGSLARAQPQSLYSSGSTVPRTVFGTSRSARVHGFAPTDWARIAS